MSRVREREREMGILGVKCAAAAAATKMVRLSKFTRSVVFASEVRRRYRLAGGRIILRTSSCILSCRTLSAVMHLLMLCVCAKRPIVPRRCAHDYKIVTTYVSLKINPNYIIRNKL